MQTNTNLQTVKTLILAQSGVLHAEALTVEYNTLPNQGRKYVLYVWYQLPKPVHETEYREFNNKLTVTMKKKQKRIIE